MQTRHEILSALLTIATICAKSGDCDDCLAQSNFNSCILGFDGFGQNEIEELVESLQAKVNKLRKTEEE